MSYVLLYSDGGFVGIDSSSGGYPWNCGHDLNHAHFWFEDEARRYIKMFPELRLFKLAYQLSAME